MAGKRRGAYHALIVVLGLSVLGLSVGTTRAAAPIQTVNANVVNTPSRPVPTQNVGGGAATGVGQPVSNIVNLICQDTNFCGLAESSGTVFSVPSGKSLVLTDVQWRGTVPATTVAPGNYASLEIVEKSATSGTPLAILSALVDGADICAGQAHLATGVVVRAGSNILAALSGIGTGTFFLQGYLVPNQ